MRMTFDCVQAVVDKVAVRLEALLARKPFTQLGGLQLDKDARQLVRRSGQPPVPVVVLVSCEPR